ncbi:MAG TPA: peptidase M6 [Micromonosporaceae bacterium]|nr:peptidase M6 [Micromonosporaceae bacterium]
MFDRKLLAVLCAASVIVGTVATPAAAEQTDRGCKITSPPEGWPGGGIPGYNTRLHAGHNTDWANQVRPIGDVKAVMLFVDFPNATATTGTQEYYDFLVPQSVEFFQTASYGTFRLTVDAPKKWYRLSKNDSEYGMGYIVSPETQAAYIDEAMRLADNEVDFSQYQAIYLVPPRNAANIPFSPEWNDYRGVVVHDGKVFKNGVTFGQDAWFWGHRILNHETGHDMGLPEDYNATGAGPTFAFTGGWDVMGNIKGHAPDFFAWEKWKLGWLTDRQVACVSGNARGTVRLLSPIEEPGGTKAIVVRTGRYTAWVAEVRQPIKLDEQACNKGVLIYKIDASVPNGGPSTRVFDANPAGEGCGVPGQRTDPLNDAPFDTGGVFEDPQTGVKIRVLADINGSYLVVATV